MKKPLRATSPKKSVSQDVILDDIDAKLGLVVEGQFALHEQIVHVDAKLEEFREEVNYKFDIVLDELHEIRGELKSKVDRKEFDALQKRTTRLKE